VAGLAKQLPRRTVTVLKAESIINDGTALVLFAVAVSVAVGGHPASPAALTARFVGSYVGGICAGLLVGLAMTQARRRTDAPLEEGALSLLTPFAAFLLAQAIQGSGVVAVLVSALMLAYATPHVTRARSRLQTFAFWDLATFLINGSLWVFVGTQMPHAVRGIASVGGGLKHATLLALAVTGVIIVSRFACAEAVTVLLRTFDRRAVQRTRRVAWRQRMVSHWAGFRGAVSLAAALAVPLTTRSGAPFPDRNLIVFVVCVVILVTVFVQGSTLPDVVRWARMPEDVSHADELQLARCRGSQAALEALPVVAGEIGINEELLRRLRKEYEEHAALIEANADGEGPNKVTERNDQLRRVRLGVLEHKRRAIIELRDQNRIDDIVLREVQAVMDLEEVRLLEPADTE
jgi:monovalent cation/hydrogen antiporter